MSYNKSSVIISYFLSLYFSSFCLYLTKIFILIGRPTDGEDFNFAEIHPVIDQRKLYNDVSERESAVVGVSALDCDCSSIRYSPRILTTQSVVPYNRCLSGRIGIG